MGVWFWGGEKVYCRGICIWEIVMIVFCEIEFVGCVMKRIVEFKNLCVFVVFEWKDLLVVWVRISEMMKGGLKFNGRWYLVDRYVGKFW